MRAPSTAANVVFRHVVVRGSGRACNQRLRHRGEVWKELSSSPWDFNTDFGLDDTRQYYSTC